MLKLHLCPASRAVLSYTWHMTTQRFDELAHAALAALAWAIVCAFIGFVINFSQYGNPHGWLSSGFGHFVGGFLFLGLPPLVFVAVLYYKVRKLNKRL